MVVQHKILDLLRWCVTQCVANFVINEIYTNIAICKPKHSSDSIKEAKTRN